MVLRFRKKEEELDEAMTDKESRFKKALILKVANEGLPTLADYMRKFHFNFISYEQAERLLGDRYFVACIVPSKGTIIVNKQLLADTITTILIHECGHDVFRHLKHEKAKLDALGIKNPSQLAHTLANYAGDFHISNELYDDENKLYATNIRFDDNTKVEGLITEYCFKKYPKMWKMNFDELWDTMVDRWHITKEMLDADALVDDPSFDADPEFAAGWKAFVDAYNSGEITLEEAEQYYDSVLDLPDEAEEDKEELTEDINKVTNGLSGEKLNGFRTALKQFVEAGRSTEDDPFAQQPPVDMPKMKGLEQLPQNPKAPKVLARPENPSGSDNSDNNNSEDEAGDEKKTGSSSGEKEEDKEKSKGDGKAAHDKAIQQKLDEIEKELAQTTGKRLRELTPEEKAALYDKLKAERDSAEDVIDDADDKIDPNNPTREINKEKLQAKLAQISDYFSDEQMAKDLRSEVSLRRQVKQVQNKKEQDQIKKATRNYDIPALKFPEILHKIINTLKTAPKIKRISSWAYYNPRSDDLGYVAPGRGYQEIENEKPTVYFYFDWSNSWYDDPKKLAMGEQIREGLLDLQKQDMINVVCKYFGLNVADNPSGVNKGNYDQPGPDIFTGLQEGRIDNLIIMTDNNPRCFQNLDVPGYVWLLFYDSVSYDYVERTHGAKGTSAWMIDHSDFVVPKNFVRPDDKKSKSK